MTDIPRNVMGLKAEEYGNINSPQIQSGFELIQEILSNKEVRFETILDIGCGTGNVTRHLENWLPNSSFKNVIGLDIDPEMIEVANKLKNSRSSSVAFSFHISDISSPWEKLDKNITTLESTVDLIFSNMALHWLSEDQIEPALRNIVRLLKPGSGWFYSKQAIGRHFLNCLEDEGQLTEIQPYLDLKFSQNPRMEGGHWKETSELVGLSKVSSRIEERVREVRTKGYDKFLQILTSFYIKKYVKFGQLLDENIMRMLTSAIQKACGHDLNEDVILHHTTNFVICGVRPV